MLLQPSDLGNGRKLRVWRKRTLSEDAQFEGYVANVGAAQAANQNTVQQLVARNNMQANAISQLQQQHAQMAAAMSQAPVSLPA